MKRLSLEVFKARQLTPKNNLNQLLGQVLGDCHDHASGGEKDARSQESDDQRLYPK